MKNPVNPVAEPFYPTPEALCNTDLGEDELRHGKGF